MTETIWKLSPSDFAFLWEECKRCFYLKVKGFYRPQQFFPRIFNIIDEQIKICFSELRIDNLVTGAPRGNIKYSDEWVESQPINFTDINSACFIRGKFDSIVQFDDNAYGVIDFKTADISTNHINTYARQLHAYAYALENPTPRGFSCEPISKLGLIIYEPTTFACGLQGEAMLNGNLRWLEVPLDNESFLSFLHEVAAVIDANEPPSPSPTCEWCKYREKSRAINY